MRGAVPGGMEKVMRSGRPQEQRTASLPFHSGGSKRWSRVRENGKKGSIAIATPLQPLPATRGRANEGSFIRMLGGD